MKIYVGNLSYTTTEETLREQFSQHGTVDEVTVVKDRETGRSRGFAFVTMPNASEATAAMEAVNGTDIDGRAVSANEARPKRSDDRGGRGGGRGGSQRDRDRG
ncbi:MAG: RNA-binding protein [Candidatus Krumholzibacteria bacterium]|nr:RNA-binding protein [Candidatus Krumholzibacteria bacterium]